MLGNDVLNRALWLQKKKKRLGGRKNGEKREKTLTKGKVEALATLGGKGGITGREVDDQVSERPMQQQREKREHCTTNLDKKQRKGKCGALDGKRSEVQVPRREEFR